MCGCVYVRRCVCVDVCMCVSIGLSVCMFVYTFIFPMYMVFHFHDSVKLIRNWCSTRCDYRCNQKMMHESTTTNNKGEVAVIVYVLVKSVNLQTQLMKYFECRWHVIIFETFKSTRVNTQQRDLHYYRCDSVSLLHCDIYQRRGQEFPCLMLKKTRRS